MVALSVLDLVPVAQGSNAAAALGNALDLARHAELLGYRRYWVAEHHGMAGVASAATAVVIGHIAGGTSSIRVGAGGIMLPNHAPLVIAEQFGTLESLYPGRIDLGLGRAPGTDPQTSAALRRTLHSDPNAFGQDVRELMGYFQPAGPNQPVRAVPGAGLDLPVWILGSSTFGAQVAAALSLPYAFASHFAPDQLDDALALYRDRFVPSPRMPRPYAAAGLNVFAADTDEEASFLFTSLQQAFVNLRRGQPGPLPPPVSDRQDPPDPMAQAMLARALSCSVVGSPATVRAGILDFARRTGVDEIMVTAQIFNHAARRHSFALAAQAVLPALAA